MSHTDASGAEDIALRQGFQTLEGNDAYGYLRFLDEEGGEISRIQREERFIKAFLNQSRNHFRIYTWGWSAITGMHWIPISVRQKRQILPMTSADFRLTSCISLFCPVRPGAMSM